MPDKGMVGCRAIASECSDPQAPARQDFGLGQGKSMDIDEVFGSFHTVFHQIDKIRAAGEQLDVIRMADGLQSFVRGVGALVFEGIHRELRYTLCIAWTIPGYAPHRQMFPLILSRICSTVRSIGSELCSTSSNMATAEQICPDVQ